MQTKEQAHKIVILPGSRLQLPNGKVIIVLESFVAQSVDNISINAMTDISITVDR